MARHADTGSQSNNTERCSVTWTEEEKRARLQALVEEKITEPEVRDLLLATAAYMKIKEKYERMVVAAQQIDGARFNGWIRATVSLGTQALLKLNETLREQGVLPPNNSDRTP